MKFKQMKNVYNFKRFALLIFISFLFFFCLNSIFKSCKKSNETNISNIHKKNIEKVNNEKANIKILQTKDSIIDAKIKEIDSLRLELGVLGSDADELYKFLSNRYDKNPKR
jgi:hypothetical protein